MDIHLRGLFYAGEKVGMVIIAKKVVFEKWLGIYDKNSKERQN